MAPAYHQPSVEPIVEDSEDEFASRHRGEIRSARGFGSAHQDPSSSQRHHTSEKDTNEKMLPAKTLVSKSKPRRSHKSNSSMTTTSAKHSTRAKGKSQSSSGQGSSSSTIDDRELYPPPRRRHTRTRSERAPHSGDSSGSDGEEPIEDHREVLAATRGRLTSPSVLSIQTSLTTATNTSSGSSGSNSTVTQASVSKGSSGKRAEGNPPSPAVPDPPDVFAYMEHDSVPESFASFTSPSPVPHDIEQSQHASTSSASSSFHSDNASEQTVDLDTDRSTSPERSDKGRNDGDNQNSWDPDTTSNHENDGYTSSASAKYEAQLLAAQERQSLHERVPRPSPIYHHPQPRYQQPSDFQELSSRPQSQPQTIPLTPGNIPLSGYNLIAQSVSGPGRKLAPIYRRFEALNHRVLLGLQDEIGELEDELKRLDDWDTDARSFGVSVSGPSAHSSRKPASPHISSSSSSSVTPGFQEHGMPNGNIDTIATGNQNSTGRSVHIARHVHPSSRRHETRYPSDISYSKSQLLQTLQYKLAQYNIHLKAFNEASKLATPRDGEVEEYRQFLRWKKPVVELESRYIDEATEGDLVVIGGGSGSSLGNRSRESGTVGQYSSTRALRRSSPSSASFSYEEVSQEGDSSVVENAPPIPLPTLATALAAAFLIPILTFGIIPNWLGRMTVVLLVGLGVWGGVWQSLSLSKRPGEGVGNGERREWMVGSDALTVAGVYGAVMGVVAAIIR